MFGRRQLVFGGLAGGLTLSTLTSAQTDYPTRPIRVIVPFAAGSATDIMMRILEQHMSRSLGQQLVLENRPGASGVIGADLARRAAPDGYTLVMDAASSHSIVAATRPKTLPYNLLTDFTAIGRACTSANLIAVNPSVPAKNLPDLIAYSNTIPAGLSFASGGPGSSNGLAGEMLRLKGARIVSVPYNDTNRAVTDVIAGHIPILIYTVALLPHIRSGRLRGLAVTSEQRVRQAPDIPTAIEQGVPGMVANSWFGLFGPAGLPIHMRDKLHNALAAAVYDPDINNKLVEAGLEPAILKPAETDAYVASQISLWKDVISRGGVKLDE